MSRITRILVALVSVGLFTIFFVFSFSFLCYLFLNNHTNKKNDSNQTSLLQYQEISSSSSNHITTKSGFVEINQNFSDDEFISYFNPITESSVIISRFVNSHFECSGTCSCTNSFRKSSNMFTRSLFIAFSAFSSSLALQIASKTFHDQCLHQMSEICDEQNIESEVMSCSERDEDGGIGEVEEEKNEYAEYSCTGHCLPSKAFRSPSSVEAQNDFFEREGKCEELKMSGEIKIERKIRKTKQTQVLKSGKKKIYPHRYASMQIYARVTFYRDYMTNYCKEMSKRSYLWINPNNSGQTMRLTANFCVGGYYGVTLGNIQCTLTSESKQHTPTDILEEGKRNLRKTKGELLG